MKQFFIIYLSEDGAYGYKPAKVNLPKGTRICIDREKMRFATVQKCVESTAEMMKHQWAAAKGQNKYIDTLANFRVIFESSFD